VHDEVPPPNPSQPTVQPRAPHPQVGAAGRAIGGKVQEAGEEIEEVTRNNMGVVYTGGVRGGVGGVRGRRRRGGLIGWAGGKESERGGLCMGGAASFSSQSPNPPQPTLNTNANGTQPGALRWAPRC